MADLYGMARGALNRPGFLDFQRESEEFEARKRARQQQEQMAQLEAQKIQMELASGAAGNDPASVREYNFFNKLSPEEQSRYLNMKRSSQIMNLGGQMAVRDPLGGGISEAYTVTPKITETPEYQAAQAGASEAAKLGQKLQYEPAIAEAISGGKVSAERQTELSELEATLPQLEETVQKLSALGKEATYTSAGQIGDIVRRETGMGASKGAIARKEYESLVNNQILPLLRQTFGAQFTEREGEQLRKTLGDVNATPEEKDAVLRSFIDQKKAQIQTLKRQIDPMAASQAAIQQRQSEVGANPNQRQDLDPLGIR